MPTTRQRLWAFVFILTFALMVGMFGYAAQDVDYLMFFAFLTLAAILVGVSLALTGLVTWRYRSFRRFFAPINLGLLFILMLAFTRYFYERSKFPAEFENAKAYATLAVPALNHYHSQHGLYPDSLDQLGLQMPTPDGLYYAHIVNPKDDDIASCEEGPGNDVYSIEFKEALLCPDGHWFIDD